MSSDDWGDILYRLENTHPNNYSDAELMRRAASEIRRLREEVEKKAEPK